MELGRYRAQVGSCLLELPIVEVSEDLAIALLLTVEQPISVLAQLGRELAEHLEPRGPEAVVTIATMGIPLGIEVARALELDEYVVVHKTPKIHLHDAVAAPVRSITTAAPQTLLLDRTRGAALAGVKVALIDDVVSTGATMVAALSLLRAVDAEVVGIGALCTEGAAWRDALGADAALVHALGVLPLLVRQPDGALTADWA